MMDLSNGRNLRAEDLSEHDGVYEVARVKISGQSVAVVTVQVKNFWSCKDRIIAGT